MKKINLFVEVSIFVFSFLSCVSTPKQPVDRGVYNPDNVPENDLCILYLQDYIRVKQIDDTKVSWFKEGRETFPQVVKIPAGVHSFLVWYYSGTQVSRVDLTVIGQFEKGKSYRLRGEVSGNDIKYHIYEYQDNIEGKDVALDVDKLQGKAPGALSTYIKYVMNPTMDDIGHTVKLENDKYILMFKPDMVYTLTDKTTGQISEGRHGFNMDFLMTEGKLFLFETNITKMSRQDFLTSKYTETAQTVLVPIKCTESDVTYKYEKPDNKKGTEITFLIMEIK